MALCIYQFYRQQTRFQYTKQIPHGQSLSAQKEYFASLRIMKLVSPYFLSRYRNGSQLDIQKRHINGVWHTVERFNHGLAHGLRQGALAKDIVDILYCARPSNCAFANRWFSRMDQAKACGRNLIFSQTGNGRILSKIGPAKRRFQLCRSHALQTIRMARYDQFSKSSKVFKNLQRRS